MKKAPKLVTVVVFTTITVISWIFLTVYEILSTPKSVQVDEKLLAPINPTLNSELLESIPGRIYFEEGSTAPLSAPSVISVPLSNPTPTAATTSSETAELTTDQVAAP